MGFRTAQTYKEDPTHRFNLIFSSGQFFFLAMVPVALDLHTCQSVLYVGIRLVAFVCCMPFRW